MKLIRMALMVFVVILSLASAGCSGPDDDGGVPPDLTLTIPSNSQARVVAQQVVSELPGVRGVKAVYHEPGEVLDLWVQYEMVPDRWPFVEKIQLAVDSAVRDYSSVRETTVRVWILDYQRGQAAADT
ncbi:hypothetical protein [Arthrobacter sp. H14]|uniref:hypothetical protein n=1 Tax=Arthrobacter sp. H14 TaxID=1312959 RepID=UPI00047919CC|nr:hypothetical protein [Arthrobacter sp. H14]